MHFNSIVGCIKKETWNEVYVSLAQVKLYNSGISLAKS